MTGESLLAVATRVLHYSPATGCFTNMKKPPRGRDSLIAGSEHRTGYWQVSVKGRLYLAHRLAWLFHYGKWPDHSIDHINGDKQDNRICNLRDVPQHINAQNRRKVFANKKSAAPLGVTLVKKTGKWEAQIKVNNRSVSLGKFSDMHEAHAAYVQAKRELHEGNTL